MLEDRYTRLQQMEWWQQETVAGARAVIAGCGALGNEVFKNLLLLGWGHIILVDFDAVSPSNLSRSAFFRAGDVGKPKTAVLIERGAEVNPDCSVIALEGNLRLRLSSGLLSRADVVFGCLDNVGARLGLSRMAGESGTLYLDGGLSVWEGTVSVFRDVDGPCYACGLTATDLRELNLRRSCPAYAARARGAQGVPTTPTVSSIVAAQMVQLALKHLHGPVAFPKFPLGQQVRFDTAHERFWKIAMPRNPDCILHPERVSATTLAGSGWTDSWRQIVAAARAQLAMPDCTFHLPVAVLESWRCPSCGAEQASPRAHLLDDRVLCSECGADAVPLLRNQIVGDEPFLSMSPSAMGFPPWIWIAAVDGQGREEVIEVGNVDGDLALFDRSIAHGVGI